EKVSYSKFLIQNSNYLLSGQILSVTCDNATSNDVMISHLATILEEFPGSANRTRCFAHILNLVAKCIMRQFDAPKTRKKPVKDNIVAENGDSDSDYEDDVIAESDN